MDTNMPLTDMEVRSAKPGARLVKLSDGGGLQLWIMPDGAKLAYRFAGGQKLLAIGVYPATGLREAREAREDAKRLLADGKDPSLAKKLAKAAKAAASPILSTPSPANYWTRSGARRRPNGPTGRYRARK
jgi:Arm DNA-binding domain